MTDPAGTHPETGGGGSPPDLSAVADAIRAGDRDRLLSFFPDDADRADIQRLVDGSGLSRPATDIRYEGPTYLVTSDDAGENAFIVGRDRSQPGGLFVIHVRDASGHPFADGDVTPEQIRSLLSYDREWRPGLRVETGTRYRLQGDLVLTRFGTAAGYDHLSPLDAVRQVRAGLVARHDGSLQPSMDDELAGGVRQQLLRADDHLVALDSGVRVDVARLDLLVAPAPTRLTVSHPEHAQRTVPLPAGVYSLRTIPGPATANVRPFWLSRFGDRE